ncbi:MAG: hypothetical protein WBO77_02735 [Microgenomates group bacterium]
MLTEHLQSIETGDTTIEFAARELHRQLLINDQLILDKQGIVSEESRQTVFEHLVTTSWEGKHHTAKGETVRYVPVNLSIDELVSLTRRSGYGMLSSRIAPYIAQDEFWAQRDVNQVASEQKIHPDITLDLTPQSAVEHVLYENLQITNYVSALNAVRLQLQHFGNPPNIHYLTRGPILVPIFDINFQFPTNGVAQLHAYTGVESSEEARKFASQCQALVQFITEMFQITSNLPATRYIIAAPFDPFEALRTQDENASEPWLADSTTNGDLLRMYELMHVEKV